MSTPSHPSDLAKNKRHQLIKLIDDVVVNKDLRRQLDEHPIETLKEYDIELPEEKQVALYNKRLSEILQQQSFFGAARVNTVTDVVSDIVTDVFDAVSTTVDTEASPHSQSDIIRGDERDHRTG